MKQTNRLSEGNVYQVLLSFSIPFLIANMIQALYGAVDLAVIGWACSAESVAAVSTGTQVTQIITSVISGLTLGATILVGRYIGKNQPKTASAVIGTTLTVFFWVALILSILMIAGCEGILTLLKTPQESFALAKQYVVVCSLGIVFICGYNAISAILRGYGDSRRPMLFVALACVLNVCLDFVFVIFFDMGVAGVALATVLAQALSMICSIITLRRSHFIFDFKLASFRIDLTLLKELAWIGIPISLQECMVRLSFLYLTAATNRLGVSAAAAVGIAARYDVFAMLPATSLSSALAAITAQNWGAGKMERVYASLRAGLGFALLGSLIFYLWAQFSPATMIGVFSHDSSIVAAGIPFFRSCSYDYLAVTFVFCFNGVLNGQSKTIFTMISCCFGALCLRIPLITLALRYSADDLFVLGMIAPVVSLIMAAYTLVYIFHLFHKQQRRGMS